MEGEREGQERDREREGNAKRRVDTSLMIRARSKLGHWFAWFRQVLTGSAPVLCFALIIRAVYIDLHPHQ